MNIRSTTRTSGRVSRAISAASTLATSSASTNAMASASASSGRRNVAALRRRSCTTIDHGSGAHSSAISGARFCVSDGTMTVTCAP
ncbi:hypothetical protein [Dactylosporangium cerinum]